MDLSLAQRVKGIREVKAGAEPRRWSQAAVAARADINRALINQIESGKDKNPTMQTLLKLSQALEVSLEWLASGRLERGESIQKRATKESYDRFVSANNLSDGEKAALLKVARRVRAPVTVQGWQERWRSMNGS